VNHANSDEMYICIYSNRDGEVLLFHHEGGIDIGDVESKALKYSIPIDQSFDRTKMENSLLKNVSNDRRSYVKKFDLLIFFICSLRLLAKFITKLFEVYMDLQFTYLEINPLVVTAESVYILDLASRLDQTAEYLCASKWGKIQFPPPFGRDAYAEV
jgi:ATP citrate (pro-S)-lyase